MSDKAYVIKGSECGRDKGGNFHCKCGKCTPRKIVAPFLYLRTKYKLQKNPVKLIFYKKGDKKYLAVVRTNWQGVKWSRHFEIIREIDSNGETIEFKANPVVRT